MAFFILLGEILFSFSASMFIIYYYGNIFNQNLFVTISSLVVWFFSLVVIFLLPLDISSSFYDYCKGLNSSNSSCPLPLSYISADPVRILWYILYWTLQLLSWLILPLFQSFVSIHYFSVWKRLLWSLIQTGMVFLTLIFVCIIIMIFLVVKEGWSLSNILSMAVTASNLWVLFFLILLVGYGLVELPRFLLKRSRYRSYLRYLYFQAAKSYTEKLEAEIHMQETENEIKYYHRIIKYSDPFYIYIQSIIKRLPLEAISQFTDENNDFQDYSPKEEKITLQILEKLNEKAIKSTWELFQCTAQWKQLTGHIIGIENIIDNMNNPKRLLENSNSLNLNCPRKIQYCIARMNWIWSIYILRGLYLMFFVLSTLFSFIIFVSEVTIFLNQFAKVTLLAYINDIGMYSKNYLFSEIISIIFLAYISLCAYYSVFKIRIFNKYRLCSDHLTNEFSLLFSAILLSRLITAMCLNYLYLVDLARLPSNSIRLSSNVKPTFFDIWGSTVPEVAVLFFIYFPLVIIIVIISTILQLDRRVLSFFGFQQFIGDEEMIFELVNEGKQYIQMEKKHINKQTLNLKKNRKSIVYKNYRERANLREHDRIDLSSRSNKNPTLIGDIISNFKAYLPQRKTLSISSQNYTPLSSEIPNDTSIVCNRLHYIRRPESASISIVDDEIILDAVKSHISTNDNSILLPINHPKDIFKDI